MTKRTDKSCFSLRGFSEAPHLSPWWLERVCWSSCTHWKRMPHRNLREGAFLVYSSTSPIGRQSLEHGEVSPHLMSGIFWSFHSFVLSSSVPGNEVVLWGGALSRPLRSHWDNFCWLNGTVISPFLSLFTGSLTRDTVNASTTQHNNCWGLLQTV